MPDGLSTGAVCLLVALQSLGLTAAWLSRVGGNSRQPLFQRLFFSSFALLGGATIGAMSVGTTPCMCSSAVLAVMVLGATWDFGAVGPR